MKILTLIACAAIGLIGCATTELDCAAPEAVGLNGEKLSGIGPAMQAFVDDGTVSGVVTLVAKDGHVVSLESAGLADIESGRAMEGDTIFRIASMTKPITATALMMLVEEGKVDLDEPVSDYIPAFATVRTADGPAAQAITLRHCLTHTAGLGGSQLFTTSLAENMDDLAGRELLFQPGEKWSYSPGLNVAARVTEIVSGQSYDEFLQARIFDPLGMSDTTFNPTEAQWQRVARLYDRDGGKLVEVKEGWSQMLGHGSPAQPSGGLFSTAQDIAKFYIMVLNGGKFGGKRILSEQSVAEMTAVQYEHIPTGFTPGNGWGLGWCVIREPQGITSALSTGTYGHGGAFGTQGWVDPKTQMVHVLMIQRTGLPNSDGSKLRKAFHDATMAARQ